MIGLKYYLQLLDNLKKGKIAPVNLFYGPEGYLREQAILQYKKALVAPETEEFNFNSLDGSEVSEEEVVAVASASPMCGEMRLVVVRRARFLASPAGGGENSSPGRTKKSSPLVSFVSAPPKNTCLILETGDAVDRRRKLFKDIARLGGAVEFSRLRKTDLARWVHQLARRRGKQIAGPEIELLLSLCGADMYDIYNEVSKLVSYTGDSTSIREEDIRFLVAHRGQENIFAVVDALGNKKYTEALEGIRYLLLCRESPQAILGMLARQVRLIMQAGELARTGHSFTEINKRMGVHNFTCKKALSQSKNFKPEELVNLLRGMLKVDRDVKTGRQDFYPAIEMLFMDTCMK